MMHFKLFYVQVYQPMYAYMFVLEKRLEQLGSIVVNDLSGNH